MSGTTSTSPSTSLTSKLEAACEIRSWRALPLDQKKQLLDRLSIKQLQWLKFQADSTRGWWTCARENQLPPIRPQPWTYWLVLAGRGWGKTRTGAEWVRSKVESGQAGRIALIAQDPAEARDVIVEGESGLLATSPPWFRPVYQPSMKRLTWPNGAIATTYSASEPEELRGPQHDLAWCDELAKWRYQTETWDNLLFGLRLGKNPQVCITTTPRPTKLVKALLKDPLTVTTHGTTYENLDNLSPVYRSIIARYQGTRHGRQELEAALLDDVPGALWTSGLIEQHRSHEVPSLARVVVGVDPSATEEGDEAGIVVAGRGADGHGYVLADATLRGRPEAWAKRVVESYHLWSADRVIAEQNNGGEMIEAVIKSVDPSVPVKLVSASRGKITRAEPISALYEQGLVHHVGLFEKLEDEMCEYTQLDMKGVGRKDSPDRMDALVWALTELFGRSVVDMRDAEVEVTMLSALEFPG